MLHGDKRNKRHAPEELCGKHVRATSGFNGLLPCICRAWHHKSKLELPLCAAHIDTLLCEAAPRPSTGT